MPSTPQLDVPRLIRDPFGPYHEDVILDTIFSRGKTLELTSVILECGGSPIGFDETEFIISAPETSRVAQHPVYFFGKLQIASLDWLTPKAKKWLEADLRKRDQELNILGGPSGLTLERLYGNVKNEGSRITVLIGCEKSMNALFLVKPDPTSFILHSKHDKRYRVLSLDVGTFHQSQNFLARYRLWALINEMIDTDPKHTPLQDRTIDWLVKTYLQRFRARENTDLYHRYIFDPDDPDVQPDGTTTTKRYLRRIPRADVRGHFAAHAEWILAQMIAPSSSLQYKLNVAKWIEFCKQVKKERRDASRSGVQWGIPYGGRKPAWAGGNHIDLTQFGKDTAFWEKRIKRATARPKSKVVVRPASPVDTSLETRRAPAPRFIHDPDFLPPSESEADTDSDEPSIPSLVTRIPSFCFKAPEIPTGCFKWKCPGCSYIIDLLNISEANTEGLDQGLIDDLRKRLWTHLGEKSIQLAFLHMASNHYKAHLRQNGINIATKGDQYRLERWPPRRTSRMDGSNVVSVKMEDSS